MRTQFSIDLLLMRKYIIQEIFICLAVGLVIAFLIGNVYFAAAMFAAMVPATLAFSVAALDETDGWEQYRLMLPLSRKHMVFGRYASSAAFCALGFAIGLCIAALSWLAALALPILPNAVQIAQEFDFELATATSLAGTGVSALILAAMLPLIAKYGTTNAVRVTPVLILLAIIALFSADTAGVFANIDSVLEAFSGGSPVAIAALACAVVALLYIASCQIAYRLYATREL